MDNAGSDGICALLWASLGHHTLVCLPGQHANKAMLLCRLMVLGLIQLHLEMLSLISHEACTDHMEALGVGYFLLPHVIV